MKYRYRELHEMKDSGVERLGMIPKEWKNNKFSRIFKEFSGQGFPIELQGEMKGVPFFKVSDINLNEKYVEFANNYVSNEIISIKKWNIIPKNTIVLPKIGEALRKNHRKILKVEGLIDNNLVGLFCKEWVTNYSYYFLKYINMEWYLNPGAVPSINMNFLRESILANPNILEQQKIADFLDKKCEEFDSVIAKKEMLINKLEEAKKSLISEVVTGKVKVIEKENGEYGIIKREDHEMKDSGVEWLGMIPKEWEIVSVKNITHIYRGKFSHRPRNDIRLYINGTYPFIQTGDIAKSNKYLTKYTQALNDTGKLVSKMFPINTLLMTIAANIGDLAISKIEAFYPDSIVGFYPKKRLNAEYLFYLFSAMKQEFFSTATVNTQLNLNIDRIEKLKLAIFKEENYHEFITKYLDKKCSQFDITIEKQKEIIENLKLAKQSLISEAVTGKIEVL